MYKILSGHNNLFRIENFTDPVSSDGYWESKKEMSRKKKKKAIGIFFMESFRRLIFLMNTMFFPFTLSFAPRIPRFA